MGIAYPGSDKWYNSYERSAKMKKERRAYEKTMKGTFEQKADRLDSRETLRGTLRNQGNMATQTAADKAATVRTRLKNKSSEYQQTLANKGAATVQTMRGNVKRDEIKSTQGYYTSLANEHNAKAREGEAEATASELELGRMEKEYKREQSSPSGEIVGPSTNLMNSPVIPGQQYIPEPVDILNPSEFDKFDLNDNYIQGLESFGSNTRKRKRSLSDALGYADSEFN